jgi:sortase A
MKRLSNILLLIGGAALVWCTVVWTGTALFDWYEGRELAQMPAPAAIASTAKPALPAPHRVLHPHDVIGRLEIPRLHLSTVVLEGDDSSALRFGAGHVPWTPLPGASGNVGIAAHRDTVFRRLRNIALRDDIRLTTPEGSYEYRVSSTEIVKPQDVAVLDRSAHPELTLVTCYPFSYLGSAPLRFIVHAQRVASAGS